MSKSQSYIIGTSLMVQWLRLSLPMQGVQIPSLVWELRSRAAKMQNVKQNNIVTNSIKTLKMVHIKKKKSLKKSVFPS